MHACLDERSQARVARMHLVRRMTVYVVLVYKGIRLRSYGHSFPRHQCLLINLNRLQLHGLHLQWWYLYCKHRCLDVEYLGILS